MAGKRDEAMRKAATVRAAIMARLASQEGHTMDLDMLWGKLRDTFTKEGYKDDRASMQSVLYQLKKNGQINGAKMGTHTRYWVGELERGEQVRETKTPVKRAIKSADLKVDVLKASGRVRLTINGLVIDIGVE